MFPNSLLSPSAGHHTCHEGSCTQTATSQLSWPLPSAWCEAHEPASQRAYSLPEISVKKKKGFPNTCTSQTVFNITWMSQQWNKHHPPSSCQPTACLSLVGVQLTADGVGSAELLLQLAGALHVHSVALFEEAHLPAEVSQVLQLPFVGLHRCLELVHPVRRVPEGEGRTVWEASSTGRGI